MSSSRPGFGFWVNAWWPVAVGVALIALESTKYLGSDRTSGPLRVVFEALFGPVSNANWDTIHHSIRKVGHFLGYGALGLTWLRAWLMTLPHNQFLFNAGLAIVGTAIVASCDEWHQTFLPNRTGTLWDVALDCCGALFMQAVAFLYLRSSRPVLLGPRN
jgi:VanZ family protein